MRRPVLFAVVLAMIMTAGCRKQPDLNVAGEEEKLRAVMGQINTAWETEDIEAFSRLVAHDAEMVSFGADVGERWVGWAALEEGLRRQFAVFSETEITPHHLDVELSETGRVAWLAQAMEISTKFLGSPVRLQARITAVFERREAGWLLVHFHYSVPISESRALGGGAPD